MAWSPCLICLQVPNGNLRHVYLTWWEGETKFSYRFICCEGDFADLVQPWQENAMVRRDDGQWAIQRPMFPEAA